MKALLACAAALLLPLSAFAQVWGSFSDMTYMQQPVAASGSSVPALPQPGNITMYWDSRYAPKAKTIVWRDLTNNVPMVVVNSNTSFMYNTTDGMIMGSGVMFNLGYARVQNPSSVSLGTNWSVWYTYKREDLETTRKIGFSSGNAEVMSYNQWLHFWNMASPSEIALATNHIVSVWTDVLFTQTNNATYSAYIDGVFMTNRTRTAAASMDTMGWPSGLGSSPFMGKMGQCVVWTNIVLTAADAATLHQRLTNTMFNAAGVSNALPSTSGLRNAWRTAGFTGRLYPTWTDYVSGKTFTQWAGAPSTANGDDTPIATGRGFRSWSPEGSIHIRSSWYQGNMVMPSTYTMCLVFTPMLASPVDTSPLFYTDFGAELSWNNSSSQRLRINGSSDFVSGVLAYNQTHTIFNVYNGTSSLWFIDGQYYTNVPSAAFGGNTIRTLGNYLSIPNFSFMFHGYIPEFLVYTNTSYSTNDALAYHTYGTNQYGFDWYGVTNTTAVATNAYGYYFMPCSSNLWASPILQQQTNATGEGAFLGTGGSWAHQKIKNTSSTETRIKNIRIKCGEQGGVNPVNAYVFVTRTNFPGPFPDMTYGISATNTIAAGSAGAFRDFVFDQANTPIIPPNQDFYIILRGTGSGALDVYYSTIAGGTLYQDTNYSHDQGSSEAIPTADMGFEIYICQ